MHECPAVHTLTANPIRVKHKMDYLGVVYSNEKTMDVELAPLVSAGESTMGANFLATGCYGDGSCCFSHFCVAMKQHCPPPSLTQAVPNSLEALNSNYQSLRISSRDEGRLSSTQCSDSLAALHWVQLHRLQAK